MKVSRSIFLQLLLLCVVAFIFSFSMRGCGFGWNERKAIILLFFLGFLLSAAVCSVKNSAFWSFVVGILLSLAGVFIYGFVLGFTYSDASPGPCVMNSTWAILQSFLLISSMTTIIVYPFRSNRPIVAVSACIALASLFFLVMVIPFT